MKYLYIVERRERKEKACEHDWAPYKIFSDEQTAVTSMYEGDNLYRVYISAKEYLGTKIMEIRK